MIKVRVDVDLWSHFVTEEWFTPSISFVDKENKYWEEMVLYWKDVLLTPARNGDLID